MEIYDENGENNNNKLHIIAFGGLSGATSILHIYGISFSPFFLYFSSLSLLSYACAHSGAQVGPKVGLSPLIPTPSKYTLSSARDISYFFF